MNLLYGLGFLMIAVAAVVLDDWARRWRPREPRGFEVIRKERKRGNLDRLR